ncbi:sulfatase family protein [Algoriphagus sediminis]|uniref:Sulfatase n=1 Tax=Algoriphagus sediminis TaxID=3057113 RepID=A0ABT7Y912_9BACT|nr:sulfatase [Algoriphagus sediminis]MDN3203001.1 sulfatase [Algoriphagus sediminis]
MRYFWTFFLCLLIKSFGLNAQEKPNIIFILTDDQRWDALGYAGNEIIQTPEMDRLASEGIYFENAFVTTPICAASRASVLTGTYEHTHGYTFGKEFEESFAQSSYPVLMRNSGYATAFFGKFGINYPRFSEMFDVGDSYDRNGNFQDRRGYFYKTINQDTVHLTRYTGHQAAEFIRDQSPDQPFLLSLSFSAPHAHDPAEDQYFWSAEYDNLYKDLQIPDPILSDDKYFLDQPNAVREGENRTRWYWRYDSPEKYQKSMRGYYRMISEVDSEIGRIRKILDEQGIADNTVIILMGDNGYFQGERQLAGKWLMYENSLRVPLIIYDPRSGFSKTVTDFGLNIDIAPTILGFAGVPIPASWEGENLADYVRGKRPAKKRETFTVEHLWEVDIIPASQGTRWKNWKYFRYLENPEWEELYDLDSDPLEVNNLIDDPKAKKVLKKLRMN